MIKLSKQTNYLILTSVCLLFIPFLGYSLDSNFVQKVQEIEKLAYADMNDNKITFNLLRCQHTSSEYRHDGWAIEDGIAECYYAVESAYTAGTINITCVYRCPKHNTDIGSTELDSKHLKGKAFDFDQLSSEENWKVGKAAYECNSNYVILLYYYENGDKKSKSFSEVKDENKKPWLTYTFEHGHIGI